MEAPSGFNHYLLNGTDGSENFTVRNIGTMTLSVTDANSCTATQTIRIASDCTDIRFANSFTPKGDGINDTWNITGLGDDQFVTVKVYNRYGAPVFEKRGYTSGWDGTSRGKKVKADPVEAGTSHVDLFFVFVRDGWYCLPDKLFIGKIAYQIIVWKLIRMYKICYKKWV